MAQTGGALDEAKNVQIISFGGCVFNDRGMESLGKLTQLHEVYSGSTIVSPVPGFLSSPNLTELEKLQFEPQFLSLLRRLRADLVHLSGLKHLQELTIGQMIDFPTKTVWPISRTFRQLKKLEVGELPESRLKTSPSSRVILPRHLRSISARLPEAVKKWDEAVAKKK